MKTLIEILNSQALKPYLDKANTLLELNATWCMAMQEWAQYSQVANFENGLLTLQVQDAAMATRLRYAIPEIIQTLSTNPAFTDLRQIQYKISRFCGRCV